MTARPVRRSNSLTTSAGKPAGYVGKGCARCRPQSSQCPVVLSLPALGRCEPHVLATVEAVRRVLRAVVDPTAGTRSSDADPGGDEADVGFTSGPNRLAANTTRLLGSPVPGRAARIMVTLPTEAADDPSIVEDLVAAGMEIARVNCAHDDPTAWKAMAANVRAAAQRQGRPVRILMDLAGPKLRTGPMPSALAVIKLKPRRNHRGEIVDQARVDEELAAYRIAMERRNVVIQRVVRPARLHSSDMDSPVLSESEALAIMS